MTLRARDRIALIGILIAAVVAGFYMLILKPEQNKAASLNSAIVTQRQTLAQAQQSYAAGRAAQASLKSDSGEWAALRLAVPPQSDIPALLRTLERNANAVGVKMQAIQLSGASGSSAPATSSSAPAAAPVATNVPIQLTFAGGYKALYTLVHRLDGLVVLAHGKVYADGPLLSISTVALSGAKNLTVQLTASIYQLPAATPTGTTTGGQP